MPSEIASWPDTESTSTLGRKFGDTRPGPRSRSVSACSRMPGTPPIAEPKMIPTRAGSIPFSPASVSASRPAATPRRTLRSSLRASFAETTSLGSKPLTSPATRTGRPSVSNVEIQPTPLSPAVAARQVDAASRPSGVTAPMPVIATRVTGTNPRGSSPGHREAAELAAAIERTPLHLAVREGEDVDEAGEGPAVVELEPDDVEGSAGKRAEPRL